MKYTVYVKIRSKNDKAMDVCLQDAQSLRALLKLEGWEVVEVEIL